MALLSKKKPEWSPRLMQTQSDDTPEIGYVQIAELRYDLLRWVDGRAFGYQRPLDEARIEKYVAGYQSHLVEPATINRRADGSLYVIDGQHRIEVERRLGHTVALARVFTGWTPEAEAETYSRLNTDRKRPNLWNTFGARASAGDHLALAIVGLARDCGFKVGTADRSLESIAAVNALETLYKLPDGPRLLRTTLRKIREYWPTAIAARDGVFIEGLARFIYTWDGSFYDAGGNVIDWGRTDKLFALHVASEIVQRAKALRIETGITLNATTYSLAFRDIYNGKANYTGRLVGNVAQPHRASLTGHRRTPITHGR